MTELKWKAMDCNDDRRRADHLKFVIQNYKDCSAKILKESKRIKNTYHKMINGLMSMS